MSRAKCEDCGGSGKATCRDCGGKGMITASKDRSIRSVVLGYSLWDKCLQYLHLPVDPNPCPRADDKGQYDIVLEYAKLNAAGRTFRITEWGTFEQYGAEWIMYGTVEFIGSDGSAAAQEFEFIVKDRQLVASSRVR